MTVLKEFDKIYSFEMNTLILMTYCKCKLSLRVGFDKSSSFIENMAMMKATEQNVIRMH